MRLFIKGYLELVDMARIGYNKPNGTDASVPQVVSLLLYPSGHPF